MNIPVAHFHTPAKGTASALTRLDRIIGELRRGGSVLVRTGSDAAWITAAESLTMAGLGEFMEIADTPPVIALTGQRACRLGFEVERESTVYCLKPSTALTCELVEQVVSPVAPPEGSDMVTSMLKNSQLTRGEELPEAVVAMLKHAGLLPAALLTRAKNIESTDALEISVQEIWQGLAQATDDLQIVAQARVPLEDSENTRIVAFRPRDGGAEHLAIIVGEPDTREPVMIRIHSECYTGDLLGSLRCDCGHQLRGAIALMAAAGSGIVLYLAQEGRGIGLINKLRAYQLQDSGRDTVDANLDLGFEEDERDYHSAAQMLRQLGVHQVRLLTNNPKKVNALGRLGVNVVERVAHVFPANRHNRGYLFTKGSKSGHLFDLNDLAAETSHKV